MNKLLDNLTKALAGIPEFDEAQKIEQLFKYLLLLEKWNKAYNLTAVRDTRKMIDEHIVDSLSVLPYIKGDVVLDVGTGAGLPGIPLAIAKPNWQIDLLDSNGKKMRFLRQVQFELGLENVALQPTRVEDYHPDTLYNTVISRAFAPAAKMVELCQHLMSAQTQLLTMKSRQVAAEISALPNGWQAQQTPLATANDKHRCLLQLYRI